MAGFGRGSTKALSLFRKVDNEYYMRAGEESLGFRRSKGTRD